MFADADIVLLDDVLSAVDAHVGAKIWEDVVCGLLASKTVILVTHAVQYLPQMDKIVVLEGGRIAESGSYDELHQLGGILKQLVDAHEADGALLSAQSGTSPRASTPKAQGKPSDDGKPGSGGAGGKQNNGKSGSGRDLTGQEKSAKGQVKKAVYLLYLRATSFRGVVAIVCMFALAPIMDAAQAYWLVYWSEDKLEKPTDFYLRWYNTIGIVGIGIMFLRQYMRTAVSIRASRIMHDQLLDSVLASPMSFFHTTPQGRLLNRFSNDIGTIDESLFESLCEVFRQVFPLACVLAILGGANAIFFMFLPPLTFVYWRIQTYFVRTSRSVKRLDSTTRSPIFAHFAETLNGIVTVRAFGDAQRFADQNMEKLDANACCLYTGYVLNRWLQIRTQAIVGVAFTSLTAGLAVLFKERTDPAVAGMGKTRVHFLGSCACVPLI